VRTLFIVAFLVIGVMTASSLWAQEVFSPRHEGVTPPKAVRMVGAEYTAKAAAARIGGTVTMDAVILQDGTVGEVAVTESLDASLNGLDDQALNALKKSEFEPGTKDRKAVAVRVTVRTTFTLK
jgi:TonB family protein